MTSSSTRVRFLCQPLRHTHVHAHTHAHTHTHAHMHAHTHTCTLTHTCTPTHARSHTCAVTHAHTRAHMHVRTREHPHVCTLACMQTRNARARTLIRSGRFIRHFLRPSLSDRKLLSAGCRCRPPARGPFVSRAYCKDLQILTDKLCPSSHHSPSFVG